MPSAFPPCVLFLWIAFATHQASMALAFRRHGSQGAASKAVQVADQALSEAEIADVFRGVAKITKRGKTGKAGKSGKSGGEGGVTGFITKMLIKNAANQVFKQFDRDRNGHLDARELNEALGSVTRIIGINPPQSMITQAMMMFDCDGSGTLDQYEFYLMCRQLKFLVGGGTGKMSKLSGMTMTGCHGHMGHGMMPGMPHNGMLPGMPYNGMMPGMPSNPGYGPGYGPNPGYGPGPGYSPGYGPNHYPQAGYSGANQYPNQYPQGGQVDYTGAPNMPQQVGTNGY